MFEPRLKTNGDPCCFRVTESGGMAFPKNACQSCKDFAIDRERRVHAAEQEDDMNDCTPPNPYEAGLKTLRTPEQRAAAEHRAAQFAAIDVAAAEVSAANDAAFRAMAADADDLSRFTPPDPYKALKETR